MIESRIICMQYQMTIVFKGRKLLVSRNNDISYVAGIGISACFTYDFSS